MHRSERPSPGPWKPLQMATGDASSGPSHPPLPHHTTHRSCSWRPSHSLRGRRRCKDVNLKKKKKQTKKTKQIIYSTHVGFEPWATMAHALPTELPGGHNLLYLTTAYFMECSMSLNCKSVCHSLEVMYSGAFPGLKGTASS